MKQMVEVIDLDSMSDSNSSDEIDEATDVVSRSSPMMTPRPQVVYRDSNPLVDMLVFLHTSEGAKAGKISFTSLPTEAQEVLIKGYSCQYSVDIRRQTGGTGRRKHKEFSRAMTASGQQTMLEDRRCLNFVTYNWRRSKRYDLPDDRACDLCVTTKRICARMEIIQGVVVHCLYPHPSQRGPPGTLNGDWMEVKCWTGVYE